MTNQPEATQPQAKYPFRIEHIFFGKLLFERANVIPEEGLQLPLTAEIAFGFEDAPGRFSVNLRVRSSDDTQHLLTAEVVAIAVVSYLGDGVPSDASIVEYVNDHLLVAMNSRVVHVIGAITSQMGIPPIWLPMPSAYGLDLERFAAMMGELGRSRTDQG